MADPFTFERLVQHYSPRVAIVLGSGLTGACRSFRELHSLPFRDIPGLHATTVPGHPGRLAFCCWNDAPILLFHGRLHYYEGYSHKNITVPIRLVAGTSIKTLVLTNAVGGIDPRLAPGSVVAIRKHLKLFGPNAWRDLCPEPAPAGEQIYSRRLLELMQEHAASTNRELPTGVYAALTGPSYETPAEIRALARCGAHVVGMSTALEAEAAAELGLEVAALSCVTNSAAGFCPGPITHTEVIVNARLAVEHLGKIVQELVRTL